MALSFTHKCPGLDDNFHGDPMLRAVDITHPSWVIWVRDSAGGGHPHLQLGGPPQTYLWWRRWGGSRRLLLFLFVLFFPLFFSFLKLWYDDFTKLAILL